MNRNDWPFLLHLWGLLFEWRTYVSSAHSKIRSTFLYKYLSYLEFSLCVKGLFLTVCFWLSQPTVWKHSQLAYCHYLLEWRHNGRDGIWNHQYHQCLLNYLFRRRSKKTSKLRVTGLCAGSHRRPVNFSHKLPVTRKMFPFNDVIMHQ